MLFKQYRNLDAPFTKNYRKLLSLPKTNPEAIIYLPYKYCGISLPKVSDLAQKYKWNNLLRCQGLGHSPAQCMNELLDRIPSAKQLRAIPVRVICPEHVTTANTITAFERGARFIVCSILE
jgi:hypothetical protein